VGASEEKKREQQGRERKRRRVRTRCNTLDFCLHQCREKEGFLLFPSPLLPRLPASKPPHKLSLACLLLHSEFQHASASRQTVDSDKQTSGGASKTMEGGRIFPRRLLGLYGEPERLYSALFSWCIAENMISALVLRLLGNRERTAKPALSPPSISSHTSKNPSRRRTQSPAPPRTRRSQPYSSRTPG
jgi:hypothetical protein